MPKKPSFRSTRIHPHLSFATFHQLASPFSVFARCESASFVRRCINRAINNNQLPNAISIALGKDFQRCGDEIVPITTEEEINRAAISASAQLKNARIFFEQAQAVSEEIRPIIYYYGATYLFEFFASCLVHREMNSLPGHGLFVICDNEGWKFDRNWPRSSCRVEMGTSGDFPFLVDALTVSGWPSLFSGFRLHRDTKHQPFVALENPAPLLSSKLSLDLLCNFDFDTYTKSDSVLEPWLKGADTNRIWKVTSFLIDYIIVYISSSLARYTIPAWQEIIQAAKADTYNDIKESYKGISDQVCYFFSEEHPFQYSFESRIGP